VIQGGNKFDLESSDVSSSSSRSLGVSLQGEAEDSFFFTMIWHYSVVHVAILSSLQQISDRIFLNLHFSGCFHRPHDSNYSLYTNGFHVKNLSPCYVPAYFRASIHHIALQHSLISSYNFGDHAQSSIV
jgi:hypothetical protein